MGGVVERVDIDALSEDSRTSGIILEKSCNVFVDVLTDRQTRCFVCGRHARTPATRHLHSIIHYLFILLFADVSWTLV